VCFALLPIEIFVGLCALGRASLLKSMVTPDTQLATISADQAWAHFCTRLEPLRMQKPPHKNYHWLYMAHREAAAGDPALGLECDSALPELVSDYVVVHESIKPYLADYTAADSSLYNEGSIQPTREGSEEFVQIPLTRDGPSEKEKLSDELSELSVQSEKEEAPHVEHSEQAPPVTPPSDMVSEEPALSMFAALNAPESLAVLVEPSFNLTPCTRGVYTGDCVGWMAHGYGVLNLTKCRYEGEWRMGAFHGKGVLESRVAAPFHYAGEFKHSVFHGHGTLTIGEQQIVGEFYCGEFLRGERIINGVATKHELSDPRASTGQTATLKVGPACELSVNGPIINERLYGKCTAQIDGRINMLVCNGRLYETAHKLPNGDMFKGKYRYGKLPHGHCVYVYADGSVCIGVWRKGEKVGRFIHFDSAGRKSVRVYDAPQ
jgi:hypothetical protein